VPGFPTRDDLATHSMTVSHNRIVSSSMTNTARASYLRHKFFFDSGRVSRCPCARLRLQLVERRRRRHALLHHQRLHADRRRHHRTA
jgi:hypothetical protein